MTKIDLSDLITKPTKKLPPPVSLDDLLRVPTKAEEPAEVVLFWTDWTCKCGRHFEAPTYGDTLTRYQRFKHGEPDGSIYRHYLPANHSNLPRRAEIKHIYIRDCPQCLHEERVLTDSQGDLFT